MPDSLPFRWEPPLACKMTLPRGRTQTLDKSDKFQTVNLQLQEIVANVRQLESQSMLSMEGRRFQLMIEQLSHSGGGMCELVKVEAGLMRAPA